MRKLYPTISGGREWRLPDSAEIPGAEWNVENNPVTKVSARVFHTEGNNGEVRLTVGSPSGAAWWRNVEMTAYFRYTGPHDSNGQVRHWELLARSERHDGDAVDGTHINHGVSAPAGTATWPGYPYGFASVNPHCLGSSYHGNFYVEGYGLFEKEITHTAGYASQRARTQVSGFADPLGRWFGMKYILRNALNNTRVHMELWLDPNADGQWQRVAQFVDAPGVWSATGGLDACAAAPFFYSADQLISWAGPWVVFRSDSVNMDFRWLSVREIGPL